MNTFIYLSFFRGQWWPIVAILLAFVLVLRIINVWGKWAKIAGKGDIILLLAVTVIAQANINFPFVQIAIFVGSGILAITQAQKFPAGWKRTTAMVVFLVLAFAVSVGVNFINRRIFFWVIGAIRWVIIGVFSNLGFTLIIGGCAFVIRLLFEILWQGKQIEKLTAADPAANAAKIKQLHSNKTAKVTGFIGFLFAAAAVAYIYFSFFAR